MIRRLVVVIAALALTSGCAGRSRFVVTSPLPSQTIGQRDGDTIEVIPAALDERRTTAVSVVRADSVDGRLAVCGAMVLAAPTQAIMESMAAYPVDANSDLTIGSGSDGNAPVRLAPRFMRVERRIVESGVITAKDIDFSNLQGDCVQTEIPWRAEFRSTNRLNLRRTVYSRTPMYSPVYIPQPRR